MQSKLKVLLILSLAVLLAQSAFGQANIGFKGIGGKVGFVMPEDPIDNTFGFGAVVDLGTITPAIKIGAIFEYWSKSYCEENAMFSGDWTISEIVIAPMVKYCFPSGSQIKPFVGGGVGFTIGKSNFETSDPFFGNQETSASDSEIGVFFGGGVDYELSPNLLGFVEAKYHIGGADYLGIFAGVTYLLGK
jgi:hypothetical protein